MIKLKNNIGYLIIAVGIVLIWRGVWGLADIFLIPNMPILSLVLSIILGIGLLLLHNPKQLDLEELD